MSRVVDQGKSSCGLGQDVLVFGVNETDHGTADIQTEGGELSKGSQGGVARGQRAEALFGKGVDCKVVDGGEVLNVLCYVCRSALSVEPGLVEAMHLTFLQGQGPLSGLVLFGLFGSHLVWHCLGSGEADPLVAERVRIKPTAAAGETEGTTGDVFANATTFRQTN